MFGFLEVPLVHNSEFLQGVGYFYPNFDAHKGVLALEDALTKHKTNFIQHKNKNQAFLKQYSIYNTSIQQQYQQLLAEIINR